MRAGMMMGLESPVGRSEALVKQQFIFDKFVTPQDMLDKISAVTADDIQSFAARLLRSGKASCCMLGDVDKVTTHPQERLARFMPN